MGPGARIKALNAALGATDPPGPVPAAARAAPAQEQGTRNAALELEANNVSEVRVDATAEGGKARDLVLTEQPSEGEMAKPPEDQHLENKAWVEVSNNEPEEGDLSARYFSMESADLIDTLGLSGMSILAHSNYDFMQLVSVALQSFLLQYIILAQFGLFVLQKKQEHDRAIAEDPEIKELDKEPMPLMLYLTLFSSIWLHFLSCFGDLPFSINILLRITDIHDTPKELIIAAPIFFIDAVVTPMLQLFIGALFVCTSPGAVDVLLNSCAVAFISNIDNWILGLLKNMKTLSGDKSGYTAHIPFNWKFSKVMEYTVCMLPIIPTIFSWSMISWAQSLGVTPHK